MTARPSPHPRAREDSGEHDTGKADAATEDTAVREEPAEPAEPDTAAGERPVPRGGPDPGARTLRVLAVLAVVAVLAAGWFGWTWFSAAHDDRLELARDRDTVVADISAALVTLHTIDHRTARTDVDAWLRVTTGQLGEDLAKDRQLQLDRAAGTRTVASASIRELAVTELDAHQGTARLLAVLDVRLGTRGQEPTPSRSRLTVQAQRTGEGWKISAVQAAST